MQDAVDLSVFAIEMNAKLCRFIDLTDIISGPIDVSAIRPSGAEWVQQKTLRVGA